MRFLDKLSNLIPFSKNPKEAAEYFFALNIGSNKVEAAVWGIEGKKLKIISTAQTNYKDESDLITAANYALDDALADFEPEPTKVLFGVPDSWLQDDDLKPDQLKLLRKMVKELDISPMAYVSSSHSIANLLQKIHGVPATTVLVEVTDPLNVSVVKAGKIVGNKLHKRTGNLPEDIEKTLLEFTDIEVLPSKIYIYGPEDLNKYKEELASFSWMSQLPFLHLPKIDQLDPSSTIQAICLAGASEIDSDINFHPSDLGKLNIPSYDRPVTKPGSNLDSNLKTISDEDEAGFIQGDIEQFAHPHQRPHHSPNPEPEPNLSSGRELTLFENVKSKALSPFKFLLPDDSISTKPKGRFSKKLLIIPVFLIALIAAGIFLPKATVTVFIDMQVLEKESQVTADPTLTAVNEAENNIPGKIVEASVNGTSKGTATGKKKVGDPAKGVVKIYNKTDASKSFSQGTVLNGPNNLRFTLDASVTVASQSAVRGGTSFGSATVNVTASEIGPDGNLAAGKELTFKDLSSSDYSADVDQAFSGGVSKDVTVVTSDDQKRLQATLLSELRKKAKDEIQTKLTGDMKILEEALSETVTNTTFSKKVNDQASDFSLSLTARYKGTAYSEKDLKTMVSKLVETNVPSGFELDLSKTETQADVSRLDKDGKVIFTAKFKAKLSPKLDLNDVKSQIAGKSPSEAADILKQIPNVIGSSIQTSPSLPQPLQRLPFLPQNITIDVTTK